MTENKDAFIASSAERLAHMEAVLASENIDALYAALKLWFPLRDDAGLEYHAELFTAYEKIRVMCDFVGYGIWDNLKDPLPDSPTYLLSQELCDALACWNVWYDRIDDHTYDDLPDSQPLKDREIHVFNKVGISLAYRVKSEAPKCEIYVFQENSNPYWLKVHQEGDSFFLACLEPGETT